MKALDLILAILFFLSLALFYMSIVHAEERSIDKSLFAQNGEGKSMVVVGINTHGIVPEDLECANKIAGKIKEVGTESATIDDGIKLEITWLTDDFSGLAWSDINESSYYKKSTTGKAEFKYSYLYFTEKSGGLKLRPCYRKTSAQKGEIFTIRYYDWREKAMVSDYYGIVDIEAGEKIVLGAVSKKTFYSEADVQNFVSVPGTSKSMGVSGITVNISISMGVYDRDDGMDGSFELTYNQSSLPELIEEKEFLDLFPDYHIILETVDANSGAVSIAFVNKSDEIELTDGIEDTAGYEFITVFNDDYGVDNGFAAFGPEIILSPGGGRVKISGTKYWLSLSGSKVLDIEKETTLDDIFSQTWFKKTHGDYDDFLTKDIHIGASTSYEAVPLISVKSEKEITESEKEAMTLVLVGGPVANSLVADLVSANKSLVDWDSSPGEVEVVENAFKEGQTVVIAAGHDRDATMAATELFMDSIQIEEEKEASGWGG
jgi:hypothetical protein